MERKKKRENLQYSAHCMYYAYAPICTNAVQCYIHAAWLQDMRMIFTVWTPKIIQIECMYVGYLDYFQKCWHNLFKKSVPLLVC